MIKFSEQRGKYFIDSRVQGAMLRQVVISWTLGVATYAVVALFFRVLPEWLAANANGMQRLWYHLAPVMLASIALFPLMFFLAIRFSHRFVGPMFRFRKTVQALADGEVPPRIDLRRNDFWADFADDVNRLIDERASRESAGRDAEENAAPEPTASAEPEDELVECG